MKKRKMVAFKCQSVTIIANKVVVELQAHFRTRLIWHLSVKYPQRKSQALLASDLNKKK